MLPQEPAPKEASQKNQAMSERIFRLSAIILLSLLGTVSIAPAWAKGGGGHGSGTAGGHGAGRSGGHGSGIAHGSGVAHGSGIFRAPTAFAGPVLRFGVRSSTITPPTSGSLRASPIVPRRINVADELRARGRGSFENGFPIGAWPYWPTIGTVGGEAPSSPAVIVVSAAQTPASQRTLSDQFPDYSYIPGCHAIPNGYHCDTTQKQAASP
jgi:hypothetical protein